MFQEHLFSINQPGDIIPDFTISQPICSSDFGLIEIILDSSDGTSGGLGYDVEWTGINNSDTTGLEIIIPELNYEIDSLGFGQTTITIIDNNGCTHNSILNIIEPPITNIIGDTSVCVGFNLQLSGEELSPSIVLPWQSSNENVATIDNNGLLTAFSPGVTVITYTDIEGCQATQPIVVNEIPTLTISNDTSICVGGTAQLEVDGAGVSGTYSWTPSTGLNTPNGTSVNASPIVNTTYTVVGLNTATGCENFANVTVSIIPTPIMEATPDVDLCSGDTIPFINFVSTPVATEYQWTNDYPEIGIPASGTGNIGPNIIAGVNGSDTIAFAEITVIPFLDGCPGPEDVFIINLYPDPEVDTLDSFEICSKDSLAPLVWTSNIPGTHLIGRHLLQEVRVDFQQWLGNYSPVNQPNCK